MIPFATPTLGERERDAVVRVLESGHLTTGPVVTEFESDFATFCDTDHAVATSNGTTALHTALHALDIGPGDAVVTTPFTFVATANAIRLCGAEPVFVDIDPVTYALDPEAVERVARERDDLAAILAVHLYGLPAPMGRLREIADEYDIALVEDAAQAHGARVGDQPVGSVGDVGCFSFYPTKNMTTGEGGMVVTDDQELATRARRFIDHGREGHHRHVEVGHNFRLPDLAAAIGRVQLERLPEWVERRRANAATLTEGLAGVDLVLPTEPEGLHHAYHLYTVRTTDREQFREHCHDGGVETAVYYPVPVHEQPAYADVDASCPVASRVASTVVSLPVHPALTSDEVEEIARVARTYFE